MQVKVHRPSDISSGVNQAPVNVFHETRITKHGFFSNHGLFPPRQTADARRRQARRLQGGIYEAVRKRVERGLSESREKNNDFFRIPTRFTTRNIPQYSTMRRKDSDKPLPPIERPRALWQPGYHESRLLCFSRCFPSGCGAAWDGMGRHGAAMARHGRRPSPAPATRPVRFSRITNHGFFRVFRPSGGEKCILLQGRSWALGRRLTRKAVKRYDGELCRDIS